MSIRALLGRALGPLLLPGRLATFFRRAPAIELGIADLHRALATREDRFLAMARREIFARPSGVYARLLRHAGCAYGDLEARVRADGIESTLTSLAEEGVRLSEAEFRGRVDVERSGLRFRVRPDDVAPARFDVGLLANSSGSGGSVLPCQFPVEWLALEACVVETFLAAHDLRSHVHATDDARLTGGAGVKWMVLLGRSGIACARWFVRDVRLEGRLLRAYHGIVARELAFVGSRIGAGFAGPTVATDTDVVAWIDQQRRSGRPCCIRTAVSRAVDVARTANDAGVRLDGSVFLASGEPLTGGRRRIIEASGARVVPQYGFIPGGLLGVGCARPNAADDMHVMAHVLAAIGAPGDTGPRRRLLVTTLNARAPSIMVNVENGDLAEIGDRDCGCLLGARGLATHVRRVGSDRHLTLGGGKYTIENLARLVEQTLPERCGGTVGDYQLVEEHGGDGRGHVTLRVHPRADVRDDAHLLATLRGELAAGSRGNRFVVSAWSESGALRIVRQAPAATPRGKIRPVLTLTSDLRDVADES